MRAAIVSTLDRYDATHHRPEDLSSVGFAVAVNSLKVQASTAVLQIVDDCLMVCGVMGFKNGTPFSLGRQLRDAHSARLMISNDRILANTAALLPVYRPQPSLLG
jgi:acyl-CoA dehydrogenase